MKRVSILFTLLLISTTILFGQVPKEKREKIKQLKIAFITEKMQLTPEEAEKFWPVYNAFEQKRHELKKAYRQNVKKILNLQSKEQIDIDKYNDKQIEQVMEMHLQMQEKQLQLDKEYYQALKQILPVKKIFLLTRPN